MYSWLALLNVSFHYAHCVFWIAFLHLFARAFCSVLAWGWLFFRLVTFLTLASWFSRVVSLAVHHCLDFAEGCNQGTEMSIAFWRAAFILDATARVVVPFSQTSGGRRVLRIYVSNFSYLISWCSRLGTYFGRLERSVVVVMAWSHVPHEDALEPQFWVIGVQWPLVLVR